LKNKTLITIVGPTAIGKTGLAISLARRFGAEILSADSRQFFKEMSIGTAKPSEEELMRAKHHFVDFLSIEEEYSAGQFERDALELLEKLFTHAPIAIMVGGSGLYINAVLHGFDELPSNTKIRQNLMDRLKLEGLSSLSDELKSIDPSSADGIDLQNTQRVVRALEVCLSSGKKYSEFKTHQRKERWFNTLLIGLNAERDVLYHRINTRVDDMVAQGLVEEARQLYPRRDLNALKTVGYRELFSHFDGDISLEEAIALIKQNTRRFAKRQLTWFRRNQDLQWFDALEQDKLLSTIESQLP